MNRDCFLRVAFSTHDFERYARGLFLVVYVLPTPSLMGVEDEGRRVFAGLRVEASVGRGRTGRWFTYFCAWSDAEEIATRLAEQAR